MKLTLCFVIGVGIDSGCVLETSDIDEELDSNIEGSSILVSCIASSGGKSLLSSCSEGSVRSLAFKNCCCLIWSRGCCSELCGGAENGD